MERGDTMIEEIDTIGLCVADLTRAVRFYERLGFTKTYENDRGCTMMAGKAKLFVFETGQVASCSTERDFDLFANPPGIDHLSFLVLDVDRLFADLRAGGVVFDSDPEDQDWGARVARLRDPDGNNLYLLQWL
jgi:catechol 2,3-dioxygenase-like lactoylglutathione lyase family enzyme